MGLFHKNIQKHFGWAVIVSELSHVFCCVIPTLVTILSVFANLGLFVLAPDGWLISLHEHLHKYEIHIIIFSGLMVVLGWITHLMTRRVDCHDTGCGHLPCAPQKTNNSRILLIASVLFAINIVIYFGVHRNVFQLDIFRPTISVRHSEHHHDGESH